jgi:hypothetical protein
VIILSRIEYRENTAIKSQRAKDCVMNRNPLLRAIVVLVFACFLSLMSGCASSILVDVWHDSSYQAPSTGKMLVIAMRKDAAKRRLWEDAFSDALVKRGVAATSSYSLFACAPPDTQQVIATVQANGFDAVLVVLKLPTERMKKPTSEEQNVNYTSYWQRYLTYYRDLDHPGYNDSQSVDMRAIDVTATGSGGKLIWSAKSRTPDPGSVQEAQRGIAGRVISDLAKHHIISTGK